MMGVVLVLLAAAVLSCIAGVGNVLSVRTHARSVSDLSALSAARSLYADPASTDSLVGQSSPESQQDACATASQVAWANGLMLDSCVRRGDDIVITVTANTLVPFIPTVDSTSVAGPRDCE